MGSVPRPRDRGDFRIAIICALPREADALFLLFDHFWDDEEIRYGRVEGDLNHYTTGRIGKHDVVLAHLPGMGTQSAAAAAANLRTSYAGLKLAFLVGVCGGVPKVDGLDLYLGDVVISKNIVQYDYGRLYPGSFEIKQTVKDSLERADKDIRGLFALFQTDHEAKRLEYKAAEHLRRIQNASATTSDSRRRRRQRDKYENPGRINDRLFKPNYVHQHHTDCSQCSRGYCESAAVASCSNLGCKDSRLVKRNTDIVSPKAYKPMVFIGRVGSGNTVMKSGQDRDRIAADHDLACFEMEGAGVWDEIPCIVVKGICDYADSHKNKRWQDFAAATAASVFKAMLDRYDSTDGLRSSPHHATEEPFVPCHCIPYPRNQDIIKRQGLVERLHELLPRTSTFCVAALWGLGGSGKTQIALEYAYERWEGRDSSVLWVHADTEATFIHDYKTIARKLGLTEALDGESLLEAVRDKIESLPSWVLVIDNADDIGMFHSGQNVDTSMNLLQYIPRSAVMSGTILWTSRDEAIAGRIVGESRGIEVTRMTDPEARQLLGLRPYETDYVEEDGEVARLLEELEWFALAVKQAGAFMRRTSTPVSEYLAMLSENKHRWHLFQSTQTSESQQRPGVPSSVLGTWRISIDRLQKENDLAYHILHVLGYVDNHNISYGMILEAAAFHGRKADPDDVDIDDHWLKLDIIDESVPLRQDTEVLSALKRLKEYSFIHIHRKGGREPNYEVHKLVQDAARYALHENSLLKTQAQSRSRLKRGEAYFSRVALHVISRFYPEHLDMWRQCERYTAHAARVTEWAEVCGMPNHAAGLLERVCTFLDGRGPRMERKELQLLERKYLLHEQAVGAQHPDTLFTKFSIAHVHFKLGNDALAFEIADQVYHDQQVVLGKTHDHTIATLVLKGELLRTRGDVRAAERLLAHAMHRLRDAGLERSRAASDIMHHQARTSFFKGEHDEAAHFARDALVIYEQNPPTKRDKMIECMSLLTDIYTHAGRFSEAVSLGQSALAHARDAFGHRDLVTTSILHNLGVSFFYLPQLEKAEPLARKAAETRVYLFGPEHDTTLTSFLLLADILVALGDLDGARSLVSQHQPLALKAFGPRHKLVEKWARTALSVSGTTAYHHPRLPNRRKPSVMARVLGRHGRPR